MLNEHLEHELNQRLLANADISSAAIRIKAKGDEIVLKGNVSSFREKLLAQEVANDLDSVTHVSNQLTVSPTSHQDVRDYISEARDVLADRHRLSSRCVIMTANSSVFALTGYAQNEREKVQIADAVLPVVGSLSLNNLLIANPDQVQKNSAHAELIAEKIANVVGLGSEWIRVAVANDTAQLVGKVNHLWEKEAAEVEVRRCEISRVANDLTVIHPS